ncbi:hypothetical protein F2Q68_00004954 [Brassica cretica]|uniref:Aspartic peptidase DDI1-type domain-containing protein n=2 Tax=Brassica cretica TaxID=69181 RepID=A0A8S9JIC2_BRACR|nr:hypothetical protein F2Q68_00004954 [Brassica cretica]
MPKIDVARLKALRPKPKPSEQPPEPVRTPSDDGDDPMEEDRVSTGRTLRRRKEKVAKHLKRGANEKEKENFQKRVFKIRLHKPFEEAYYSHRLWMFFRETREKEEDIRRMFCEAREKMRKRITLKKKSDPVQFAIPCTVQGIEFPHALCDTEASVSILPRVIADHLGLQVEPSQELFTFVDCSQKNSGGIVRDLDVQIGNAQVPVDLHVLDIKLNWNSSLLLGRAFLSAVGAVCNLQTNQLCLTLINPNAHYDPIPTHTATSIDSGHQKLTDTAYYKSVNTDFNRVREGNYSIGSWADEPHHGSFVVEIVTYTPGTDKLQDSFTDEELLNMQKRDDTDQFQAEATWGRTRFSESIDTRHQQSIDNLPQQSIDINNTTSINNHPIPNTTVSEKDKLDNQYLTPDEFGIFRDPNSFAKAIDGRRLHVSREDIADILQTANGADNLFMHQRSNREQKTTKEFYYTAASRDEPAYICLPEHASQFTQTKLVPEIYTKDEINEMFYGVCGEHDRNKEAFQMKSDGVYYPLNDSISWLTTCMQEMKKDIARIQNATGTAQPPSIDRRQPQSIDRHHHASIDNCLAA